MKTKSILSSLIFFISFLSFAQDIIYKTDKSEVKAKILEVLDNDIKYKKFDFQDGPTYSMPKSEIFMIIYKNGQKEMFETKKISKSNPEVKPEKVVVATKSETKKEEVEEVQPVSGYTMSKGDFGCVTFGFFLSQPENNSFIPAYGISNEIIMGKNFGFGIYISRSSTSFSYKSFGNTITSDASSGLYGIRSQYYFNDVIKLNPKTMHLYGGLTLGYAFASVTTIGTGINNDVSTGDLGYFAQVGINLFPYNRISLKAEVQKGKGDANLLIGFNYRIGPKMR
jgi:hypothetical protein